MRSRSALVPGAVVMSLLLSGCAVPRAETVPDAPAAAPQPFVESPAAKPPDRRDPLNWCRPNCRLAPGERPPQFVVISFDGAGVDGSGLFSHFRKVAADSGAAFTFFLSGIYLLPHEKRERYRPPGLPAGRSDIGFQQRSRVPAQVDQLARAWREGHEIGTHFNGHFCGANGVATWGTSDWKQEIEAFFSLVQGWRKNSGSDAPVELPFDIRSAVIGGRTPCLEGNRSAMFQAFDKYGWRYDASGTGKPQWPVKKDGIWRFRTPSIPIAGTDQQTLAMDYNFYVAHSRGKPGPAWKRWRWEQQTKDSYVAAVDRAERASRSPIFIGNHFESWNGGIYMDALTDFVEEVCPQSEMRCVSFEQLEAWLEAQDGETLRRLRSGGPRSDG